jgi:aspartate/methionine/tyrosine aminotransferase
MRGGCTPVASLARLPPEEQKDVEEVIREARKAKAAKRKAAQEEKERSSAGDQPAPEPIVQDAHQVSKDGDSGSRPTRPESVEGESVQDEPAQASEGDADPDVPPEEGLSTIGSRCGAAGRRPRSRG